MIFEDWIRQYIQRHPLKQSVPSEQTRFTAEVMERVRELPQPQPAWSVRKPLATAWMNWFTLPRMSFALAAAAAGILLVLVGSRTLPPAQLAAEIVQRAEVLAAFSDGEPLLENDIDALADEVDAGERLMMLAENPSASSDDADWIEQMSQTLDQLDEGASASTLNDPADAGWQDELEMLDDTEFSAKS